MPHNPDRLTYETARRMADMIIDGRHQDALDELRAIRPELPSANALRRLAEARARPID